MIMSLDQWAKENLSPEYQQRFFAEQKRIEEYCKRIEQWHYRPEEAMKLSQEQKDFLRKHEIVVSTAYIGMVRFYIGNRTIFQTSAMASIANALFSDDTRDESDQFLTDYDSLTNQVHEYLNLVMSASPEVQKKLLENHMPLFGSGELDAIRNMCD
jgi:hypothetical protein